MNRRSTAAPRRKPIWKKPRADFKRNKELFNHKLISESDFIGFKTALDIANAQLDSSLHQVDMARASVASAEDSLSKTIIVSPRDGTVSRLKSQVGERVLGTVQNAGTEIMTIADLNEMENTRGHRRNGRCPNSARPKSAVGRGCFQRPEIYRHRHANRQFLQRFRPDRCRRLHQQPIAGGDEI